MSSKKQFLFRPSDYDKWFAALGRRIKRMRRDGAQNPVIKDRYIEVRDLLKERNVIVRHCRWIRVYNSIFNETHSRALHESGKTKKQAFKYARQKAEQAVLEAFPEEVSSTRAVRDAVAKFQPEV